jgi:glycosyltransferase involved in cell wall biosynthesis
MKALLLINSFPDHGGAEMALATLADALQEEGVQVHLASLLGPGPLPRLTQVPSDRVVVFHLSHGSYTNLQELRRFYTYLRSQRFDLVNSHLEFANTIGVVLARLARVPVVIPVTHSMRPQRSWRRLLVNRLLARLADRQLAVSEAIVEHLSSREGIPSARLGVLRNAVDLRSLPLAGDSAQKRMLRRELGLPVAGTLLFHAGSLRAAKRQEDLLRAARIVRREIPDATLVIAGAGPRREELERLARQLLGEGGTLFLGHRRDVPHLLAAADLLLLSSVREGLPVVILESFAVGTPVVATAVGGVGELIADGITGRLVPPRRPLELAHAALEILGDSAARTRMLHAARELVQERFTPQAVARDFLCTVADARR